MIKEAARERGIALSAIARSLGMHLANVSAIAAGKRGVSLKILNKIGRMLDASLDELLGEREDEAVFRSRKLDALIDDIQRRNYDGIDKSWVDRLMLAGRSHYGKARKAR
jgi:transcriptional regulator with XRE-family HTH domain